MRISLIVIGASAIALGVAGLYSTQNVLDVLLILCGVVVLTIGIYEILKSKRLT